jgi:tRNA A37 N6-isopentenylltransferase MiaA
MNKNLMTWQFAQMHQNLFLSTPEVLKYNTWQYAKRIMTFFEHPTR